MKSTNQHPSFSFYFIKTILYTTISVALYFVFRSGIGGIMHKLNILNPIENKIEDFELSDICFRVSHRKENYFDEHVIILNCANDNRKKISEKINTLFTGDEQPASIGVDIIFDGEDTTGNAELLDAVLKHIDKIVFACEIDADIKPRLSSNFYQQLLERNYGLMPITGRLQDYNINGTTRYFEPLILLQNGVLDTSFALKTILCSYTNIALDSLFKRKSGHSEEIINYRRLNSGESRYRLHNELLNDRSVYKNKIVLLGGDDPNFNRDKWFTPFNKYAGKSAPDMAGVEIHAQIISTILNNDYLNEAGWKTKILLWILYFLMNLCFIMWIARSSSYSHILLHIVLLLYSILLLILCCWFLESFKIKFEPADFIFPFYLCALLIYPLIKKIPYVNFYFKGEENH